MENSVNTYCKNYSEVEEFRGKSIKKTVRNTAVDLLSKSNFLLNHSLNKNRIHFLMFHHIFQDEEDTIRSLFSKLSESHDFISYDEALARIKGDRKNTKPSIVLSSDDGLKSNLILSKIAEEFAAKVCFFICPTMIGCTDFLHIKNWNQKRLNFPPSQFLNWDELELLQSKGNEIGFHTNQHLNLKNEGFSKIESDLHDGLEILFNKGYQLNKNIKHFAWPYGKLFHIDKRAYDIYKKVGFSSFSSSIRGHHTDFGKENVFIRRENIVGGWPLSHNLFFIAKSASKNYENIDESSLSNE